jgi:hypothetical protein
MEVQEEIAFTYHCTDHAWNLTKYPYRLHSFLLLFVANMFNALLYLDIYRWQDAVIIT